MCIYIYIYIYMYIYIYIEREREIYIYYIHFVAADLGRHYSFIAWWCVCAIVQCQY